METSQIIVSYCPVNHMWLDLAWWRNSRLVGWRSDYEGHQSKKATKELKILFFGIIYKATWKAMEKKTFIWLLCWDHLIALSPNISSLKDETKSHNFDLQWEEESDFYMLWQYKLDKYFNLTFEENSSFNFFVIFNDCLDMLQNLDEIISKPFPVNWVLSQIWDWQTLSWFSLATIF